MLLIYSYLILLFSKFTLHICVSFQMPSYTLRFKCKTQTKNLKKLRVLYNDIYRFPITLIIQVK